MLTMLAIVIGCFGGLLVATTTLSLTSAAYLNQLHSSLDMSDLLGGLFKSGVFALAIAFISCQRGLATRGGAEGVGRSTTSAVVAILFSLVALDAVFTLLFHALGI